MKILRDYEVPLQRYMAMMDLQVTFLSISTVSETLRSRL